MTTRRQLWRLAAATLFVIAGKTGLPSGQRDWFVPILCALGGFVAMDRGTK